MPFNLNNNWKLSKTSPITLYIWWVDLCTYTSKTSQIALYIWWVDLYTYTSKTSPITLYIWWVDLCTYTSKTSPITLYIWWVDLCTYVENFINYPVHMMIWSMDTYVESSESKIQWHTFDFSREAWKLNGAQYILIERVDASCHRACHCGPVRRIYEARRDALCSLALQILYCKNQCPEILATFLESIHTRWLSRYAIMSRMFVDLLLW